MSAFVCASVADRSATGSGLAHAFLKGFRTAFLILFVSAAVAGVTMALIPLRDAVTSRTSVAATPKARRREVTGDSRDVGIGTTHPLTIA